MSRAACNACEGHLKDRKTADRLLRIATGITIGVVLVAAAALMSGVDGLRIVGDVATVVIACLIWLARTALATETDRSQDE